MKLLSKNNTPTNKHLKKDKSNQINDGDNLIFDSIDSSDSEFKIDDTDNVKKIKKKVRWQDQQH